MPTKLIFCCLTAFLFSSSLFGAATNPYHITGLRDDFALSAFNKLITQHETADDTDKSSLINDKKIGVQEFYNSLYSVYLERQASLPTLNRYSQKCCNTSLSCKDTVCDGCTSGCHFLINDPSHYWAMGGCGLATFEQLMPGLILYLLNTPCTLTAQASISTILCGGGLVLSGVHKLVRFCWNAAKALDPVVDAEEASTKHPYYHATKELLKNISSDKKEEIKNLLKEKVDLFDDEFNNILNKVVMVDY